MTGPLTRPADRAARQLLALLAAMSVTVTAAGVGTLVILLPIYRTEIAAHCTRFADWLGGHPEILVGLLPLIVVATVLSRTAWRALQQRSATFRLLAALEQVRPLPERLHRKLQQLDLAGLDIAGKVDYVAHPVPLSFCYGVRQPRICISGGLLELLDDDELTAVLRHEHHHMQRHDPARLLLARALRAGIGFVPGVSAVFERYVLATEVAADAASSVDPQGRLALAQAVLKLARAQQSLRQLSAAPVSPFSPLLLRVDSLLSPNPRSPHLDWRTMTQLAAGLGLMVLLSAAPVALAAKPDPPMLHPCETEIHRHFSHTEHAPR